MKYIRIFFIAAMLVFLCACGKQQEPDSVGENLKSDEKTLSEETGELSAVELELTGSGASDTGKDDLDGVTMRVVQNTDHSVDLEVRNGTDLDIQYGDDFLLEKLDEETGTWVPVHWLESEPAYHDIAYRVEKGKNSTWSVDWTDFYGELEPGTYRIVKEVMDFRDTGDYTVYTLMSEFAV